MKFVSNSTPLIALSKINRLDILECLCENLLIPEEVYDEVVTRGGLLFGAEDVRSASWISVVPARNKTAVDALYLNIDRGEAEAIVLATEEDALLIIDDKEGRNAALAVNLQITGTIGILLMAAEGGLINFREDFRALREAGFRISEKEYRKILDLSEF